MKFINRVKSKLLERIEKQLKDIEAKEKTLNKGYSQEHANIEMLKQEADEFSRDKTKLEKDILDDKMLKDLTNIYEFIANYPRIEKIIASMKETSRKNNNLYSSPNAETEEERLNVLCDLIKDLNKKIQEIKDADIEDLMIEKSKQDEDKDKDKGKGKGIGIGSIFSKIFRKNGAPPISDEEEPTKEKTLFEKYKEAIKEYKEIYNKFPNMGPEDLDVIDKKTVMRVLGRIRLLRNSIRARVELDEEQKEFLELVKPFELWEEIEKYYSNTQWLTEVIGNFEAEIDDYEKLYEERKDLFDLTNLERIFEEHHQIIIDLKSKSKGTQRKDKEIRNGKQREGEIQFKLKGLEKQRKTLNKQAEKIKEAKTLKKLGYKNKADAAEKLSIDTKDYIVIPIPNNIYEISDLFNQEKQIKVEIDGKTFLTTYTNNIAQGYINSIGHATTSNAVIMIPMESLSKENIDNIRDGKISLNQSVMQEKDIFAILPAGRPMNFGNLPVEIRQYTHGNIIQQLQRNFKRRLCREF